MATTVSRLSDRLPSSNNPVIIHTIVHDGLCSSDNVKIRDLVFAMDVTTFLPILVIDDSDVAATISLSRGSAREHENAMEWN
jgi:hypothetical protein